MPTYSIGELAREFEITPRTIRFYEDQGLLAPRRIGAGARQRAYSHRDRTRLKLTLRGKRLGLSLSEIRDLIDMYDSPADTVPQLTRFLEVLARHRQALESQQLDLNETLDEIREHEGRTRELLEQASQGTARGARKRRAPVSRAASR
jgi:DNA-binding transcriptional MerR regulator